MPKSDSAETLLKRLDKIERAQKRLGDITTRILTQAAALAELLEVAQAFAAQTSPAPARGGKRTTRGARRTSSARRATRTAPSAPRTATAKRTTRKPAPRAATKASSRRAPAGSAPSTT